VNVEEVAIGRWMAAVVVDNAVCRGEFGADEGSPVEVSEVGVVV
jgi:hypothetical protein